MDEFYGPALYAVRVTKPNGQFYFTTGYKRRTGIRLYEVAAARREANAINKFGVFKAEVVPVTLTFGEAM